MEYCIFILQLLVLLSKTTFCSSQNKQELKNTVFSKMNGQIINASVKITPIKDKAVEGNVIEYDGIVYKKLNEKYHSKFNGKEIRADSCGIAMIDSSTKNIIYYNKIDHKLNVDLSHDPFWLMDSILFQDASTNNTEYKKQGKLKKYTVNITDPFSQYSLIKFEFMPNGWLHSVYFEYKKNDLVNQYSHCTIIYKPIDSQQPDKSYVCDMFSENIDSKRELSEEYSSYTLINASEW